MKWLFSALFFLSGWVHTSGQRLGRLNETRLWKTAAVGETSDPACFRILQAALTSTPSKAREQAAEQVLACFLPSVSSPGDSWEVRGTGDNGNLFTCFLVQDFEQGLTHFVTLASLRLMEVLLPQLPRCGDFKTCIHPTLGQNGVHPSPLASELASRLNVEVLASCIGLTPTGESPTPFGSEH